MGGLDGGRLLDGLWRMVLASLLMAAVAWIVFDQLSQAAVIWQLVVAGLTGALAYLGASLLFGVTELQQIVSSLRQRFNR